MFTIPSLADLLGRTRSAFRSYLPGSDAWLWPNNVYVSAKVIAGAIHELFGFADYIQRQKFAITAPDSESLELHGAEFGIARRPAAPAQGYVTLTAAEAIEVADAALFRRTDGLEYRALAGGSLATAGTLDLPVVATTDGRTGNAEGGAALEIVSGVTGDATAAVADDGIVLGADIEPDGDPWTADLATYRGRILFRKRNPPHGGAAADYVMWAAQVPGVTRVYVERRYAGPGTVRVWVLMDDLYADGIPSAADIARVQDHIEVLKPAGAMVLVQAPAATPVDVTISGLAPDTTPVREAVLAELRAAFLRLSRVAGGDAAFGSMPYLAYPTSFSRSWIWQAVANAAGEGRHIVAAPTADVALATGRIATLGTVTFVP